MKEHLAARADPRLQRYDAVIHSTLRKWFSDPPADEADAMPDAAAA